MRPLVRDVIADGALAMIASADTTSSVLTSFFYYMLCNPEHYKRLREEVDRRIPANTICWFGRKRVCEYALNDFTMHVAYGMCPGTKPSGSRRRFRQMVRARCRTLPKAQQSQRGEWSPHAFSGFTPDTGARSQVRSARDTSLRPPIHPPPRPALLLPNPGHISTLELAPCS